MDKKRTPLFDDNPAAYPDKAASEANSKHLLMSLMDTRFIRGEIRIMDKYPNGDGILEVTDITGVVKGKIDIQLKTLAKERTGKPSHSCDRPFMAYCQNSTLPVILIVVDQVAGKAYWQYMNYEVLADIKERMTHKTFSLSLPLENCIDGHSLDYIPQWTKICETTYEKVWNYDFLKANHDQLTAELETLNDKFGPLTLTNNEIREVQSFLDIYNYLLDHDFRFIKQGIYSAYWKIGLGIMKYFEDQCSFVVYPIPYGINEPLIRQVRAGSIKDIQREFAMSTILKTQSFFSRNPIGQTPTRLAYEMLKSDFERVIKNVHFDVPDDFMANEYIHGFVSKFATFLGLEANAVSYDLQELRFLVNDALPLILELQLNIPEGGGRFNIDSFQKLKPHTSHLQKVEEAKRLTKNGQKSRLRIIPTSESFHLDILKYYIDHLIQRGIKQTRRIYDPNMRIKSTGGYVWEHWNNEVLNANLLVLIQNLKRVYHLLLDRYFSGIANDLSLFRDGNLLVYCLSFEHGRHAGPQLEYYQLRSRAQMPDEIDFWAESERPFEREALISLENWTFKIGRKIYDLRVTGGEKLDFMFQPLPMHTFIRELVKSRITDFFKEKLKDSSDNTY